MKENCLFCKIIEGEIPSYTIYEDKIVKVFLDINPNSPGHMLIIPKIHTLDSTTIDDDTFLYIKNIGLKMKLLVEEKLNCTGVSFIFNNGSCQEVKHFHMHLVPKYKNNIVIEVKEVFDILTKQKIISSL